MTNTDSTYAHGATITLEQWRAFKDLIRKPDWWYCITRSIQPGKVLIIGPREPFPEVWLVHPDDWPRIQDGLTPYYTLRNFRDWQASPEQIRQMLHETIRMLPPQAIEQLVTALTRQEGEWTP